MAIDWKREVSFDFLKKRGGGSSDYPTKRTMNLYVSERAESDRKRVLIVGIILLVVVVLFVHFAVMGPLMRVAEKERELSDARAGLAPIAQQVKDYDSVLAEYEKYTPVSSSSGVDSPAVLDMIERQVMPLCTVSQVNLKGTELTLTLSNVSLDTVGVIATNLSGQQGVTNVAVATAHTSAEDGSAQVVATVTVSLLGTGTSEKGGA
jgi:type II secretory pathway component PulM